MRREVQETELVIELDPDVPSGGRVSLRPIVRDDRPAAPEPEAPGAVTSDSVPERLVITAEREIVLQVGKASITLTRSGKIILRGTYLSSRSSGVNRIKGGSVQIN
jgi:hypothetical protein